MRIPERRPSNLWSRTPRLLWIIHVPSEFMLGFVRYADSTEIARTRICQPIRSIGFGLSGLVRWTNSGKYRPLMTSRLSLQQGKAKCGRILFYRICLYWINVDVGNTLLAAVRFWALCTLVPPGQCLPLGIFARYSRNREPVLLAL